MKTLGIIGGIAPPSTVDYYQRIVAGYREQRKDGSYPTMVINSIDLQKMLGFVFASELDQLADYLLREVGRLAKAGADFGLFASNTPHIVFNRVSQRSPIPLISIVECARVAAQKMGLKKLALLGLRPTMEGKFYPEAFSPSKITLIAPNADERDYIQDKYMNELIPGNFLADTREQIFAIIGQMKKRDAIDGVVLASTELPMLLRGTGDAGIPMLDTTQIHVQAAVERLLA